MTYEEVYDFLINKLPFFTKKGKKAVNKNLLNISRFCHILGNPQSKYNIIHVGGTNGKGSVTHMLSSIFQEKNYKVGINTSPHIHDYKERIKINGNNINVEFVLDFIKNYKDFIIKNNLSFFEVITAMAFQYFYVQSIDIAIIEVGLGGRWDSTNVISPILSIITNIDYDHCDILGYKITDIAYEKAGIIKKDIPVVLGKINNITVLNIFKNVCKKNNSILHLANKLNNLEKYYNLLSGAEKSYQKYNINTVIKSIEIINQISEYNISDVDICNGLKNLYKNTKFIGRWNIISYNPTTIVDVAHNEHAFYAISQSLLKYNYRKLHLVLGFLKDKNIRRIFYFFNITTTNYYFCELNSERSMKISDIKNYLTNEILNISKFYPNPLLAFEHANINSIEQDLIIVSGSHYVISDILNR